MVLIISSEADNTTNRVIKWLNFFGVAYVRVNETTRVVVKEIQMSNQNTEFKLILNDLFHRNRELKFSDITATWYRRGKIDIMFCDDSSGLLKPKARPLHKYLEREVEFVEYLIYEILKTKPHLNTYLDDQIINKLDVLRVAKKCGLNIPKSIIASSPSAIYNYIPPWQQTITKAIRYGAFYWNDTEVSAGTVLLEGWGGQENKFPSLIQEKIEKEFEIRIFYFHGHFYATAIFSQSDSQTKIDFRNYNREKPNRTPPFLVPDDLKRKIIFLMEELNLTSGSLDFIYSKAKEYIFLEVNPIGQFEQVSMPANFYIEKKIAEYLANC